MKTLLYVHFVQELHSLFIKCSYDFVFTLLEALFLSSILILQIIDKNIMYNLLHIDCQLPQ